MLISFHAKQGHYNASFNTCVKFLACEEMYFSLHIVAHISDASDINSILSVLYDVPLNLKGFGFIHHFVTISLDSDLKLELAL